jgi:proteic killer suppression protein
MLKDFFNKDTEKVWNLVFTKRFPPEVQRQGRRKLMMLNAAVTIQDLREPLSNHLEELQGDREGQHSIRVNKQWRVCFVWKTPDAYRIELNKHYE